MIPSHRTILALLAGCVTTFCLAAPATAAPPTRFVEDEPFNDTITDFCGVTGLTVVDAGVFHSDGMIRRTRAGLDAFLEHITVDETITGPTGRSVRIHTAIVQKDLKIRDNGDGTITVVQLLTGPSSVYGPDGKAIARDPGQVRFRIVISDNGTPDNPDDDFDVAFDLIKGSTGRSDDYCAAIVGVIG
jgi:hypothetical protein